MVDKYDKRHSRSSNDRQHSRMDSDHNSSNDASADDSVDFRFQELVRKMGLNRSSRPKNVFEHSPKDINIRRSIVERALLAKKKISSSTPMPHSRKLNFTPEDAAACSPIDLKETTENSSVSLRSQNATSASDSKAATLDQPKSRKASTLEAIVTKLAGIKENRCTTNRTIQTSNNKLVESVRKLARKPLAEERQTQTGDSLRRLLSKSTHVKSLPCYDELVSKKADTPSTAAAYNSTFLRTGGSVMEIVEEALKRQQPPKKGRYSDKARVNSKAPWRVASGFDSLVENDPQDENLEESLDETFVPKIKPKKKDYVKRKILVGCKKGKGESSILAKKKPKNQRSSILQVDDEEELLQDSVTARKTPSTRDVSIPEKTSSRKEKVSTSSSEASLEDNVTKRKTQKVTKDASIQCLKTLEETKTSSKREKVSTGLREESIEDTITKRKTQKDTKDASIQCLKTPEKTKTSSRREKVSTGLREESLQDLITSRHQDHATSIPEIDDGEEPLLDLVTRKTRSEATSTIDTSTLRSKSPQKTATRKNDKKNSKNRREESEQNIAQIDDREEPLEDLVSRKTRSEATSTIDTSTLRSKSPQKTATRKNDKKNSKNRREESAQNIAQIDDREEPLEDLVSRKTRSEATSTIDTSTLRSKSSQKTDTRKNDKKKSKNRREESAQNIAQIDDSEEPLRDLVSRKTRSEATSTIDNTSTLRLKSPQKTEISKSRREEQAQNSDTNTKTPVSRMKKNNLLKSAEKAGSSNASHESMLTNDPPEPYADSAMPTEDESVHRTVNNHSKLRKRLFDSTDSETAVERNKKNRTEFEEDNVGQSAAEEEPINSQLEEAAKKTAKKSSKKKEKETKDRVTQRETESTIKTPSNAKESVEDLPKGGLRKSTRERRRPPPRGTVMMFGSKYHYNLLVGVNNSYLDMSTGTNSNVSTSSLKYSRKRTTPISSIAPNLSAFPPIVEQDEDLMDAVDRSDKSPRKSVKTGRVSKKKRVQNKTKKVSTSSKSKSDPESDTPIFENENIPVSVNNKSLKTPWVSSPLQYGESGIPGVSIAVTLEERYHSSHGYMKLDPGMCKPTAITSRHSLDFLVVEGVAEVEVRNEVCIVKKSNSFTVPQGFEYCIKNTSRRGNLVLFFTRSKRNPNTTT